MIENQPQTPSPQLSPQPVNRTEPEPAFMQEQMPQPAAKKSSNKVTCLVIAAVLLCLAVAGAALAFGGLALLSGNAYSSLQMDVTTVEPVSMGQPFVIKVTLHNNGDKAVDVEYIRLGKELFDFATMTRVNPANTAVQESGDATGYKFDLTLAPDESMEVIFNFDPLKAGNVTPKIAAVSGSNEKSQDLAITIGEAVPTPVVAAPTEAGLVEGQPVTTSSGVPYEAVVEIQAYIDNEGDLVRAWWGSGTIVSPDGLILTNAHVVSDTKEFTVQDLIIAMTTSPDQPPEQHYYAEIMQLDSYMDIAVLQITADIYKFPVDKASLNLPYVKIGNSDTLQLNDEIVILGYPGIGGETITLTDGRVGGFTAEEPYGSRAFIKTSATFAGGNSGGLAINADGEMIGIPTQLGYGGEDQYADCRRLVDTNNDGVVDQYDTCIPTGGFINALRPVNLAMSYVNAALAGEVNIVQGAGVQHTYETTGEIYYEDDFSDTGTGWPVEVNDAGSYDYVDGEYQIEVSIPNQVLWVSFGEEFDDTESTLDVRPAASSEDGSFGIMCRYQDRDNFYGLEVSEDGYYSIWRRDNDEYIFLVYWEYSDLIPLHEPMTITGACVGDELSLAVNGNLIAQTTDATFKGGDLGFFASTYDNAGLIASFDNYIVRKK